MALQRAAQLWACLVFAIFCGTAYADAPGKGPSIPVAYCSSQNTGANFKPFISIYQSEGRCYGNCTDAGYALAIVQEKNCWCSNYIPNKADQKSEKECQESCPGYPTDFCGGIGRYGYLQLNAEPLGTASPANPSPGSTDSDTSTSSAVKTTETETAQVTVTRTPSVTMTSSASALESSSIHELPNEEPTSLAPKVETVTVDGSPRTVTLTPTPTGTNAAQLETPSTGSKGLSTGTAVGIAFGVIGILVIIGLAIFMLWMRRRRQRLEENHPPGTPSARGSSSGMMVSPKGAEVRESQIMVGPDGRTVMVMGSRRSTLMPVDPRLNSERLLDLNKSHDSIGSLQDNHDYSRRVHEPPKVLRATNPDPDIDDD